MKSINIKYFLVFSLLFVCCAAEKELIFTEANFNTESNSVVDINIPKASGNEQIVSKINTAIEQLIKVSLHIGEPDNISTSSLSESINKFNNEYNSFKKDYPDSAQKWEAQIDGEVMFQSKEIISIAFTSYTNTGGAHGNLVITFLNFDAITGEEIETDNLFSNLNSFKDLAKNYFEDEVDDNDDFLMDVANFELPANIGYNDEGVILLYNTYEIAPYSVGITEFTIPFDDLSSFLNYY